MHPLFKQVPPITHSSHTATSAPRSVALRAAAKAAEPPPNMTRSYCVIQSPPLYSSCSLLQIYRSILKSLITDRLDVDPRQSGQFSYGKSIHVFNINHVL